MSIAKTASEPSVVLVVDHPLRDLPGLVLAAAALCQRGITCLLTPLDLQEREIWRLAPDFVLLNYFRRHHSGFYRKLSDAAVAFGSLETEGGVADNWERFEHLIVAERELREQLSCQCCWGPRTAERFVTKGWFAARQVRLTGCPRIDFYDASWREAALASTRGSVEDWTADDRNLVLINSAFVMANPGWSSPAAQVQGLVCVHGVTLDEARERVRVEEQSMQELTSLANDLAKQFPQATFVYRPHPFEGAARYDSLLEKLPNLHCVKSGTVDGWILRAKAVIQRGCSTGYEAAMANVPTLTPRWMDMPWTLEHFDAVCHLQDSPEELANSLKAIFRGDYRGPGDAVEGARAEHIRDWYHVIDGQAHRRVALAIAEGLSPANESKRREHCARLARGEVLENSSIRSRARRVVKSLRGKFGLRTGQTKRLTAWDRSAKQFDARQVKRILDAIAVSRQGKAEELDRPLDVLTAGAAGEYSFGDGDGRSVVVRPLARAA